jgi:hypothetical protein
MTKGSKMKVFTVVRTGYEGSAEPLGVFGSRDQALAYIEVRWKRGIDTSIGFVESVLGQEIEHGCFDAVVQWLK